MHELGIVMHVAEVLADAAAEHHITKIGSVTLEIGEVSGIMTDYFEDCWDYFKVRRPLLAESELRIELIPARTYCEQCGGTYPTVRYAKICPYCGSGRTYLLQGNECSIREIEAETSEYGDEKKNVSE